MPQSHTLHLLGSPRIEGDDRPLSIPSKQAAVLAVLAYQHPRPVSRDYLAQLLWPAVSRQSALHSLSQAMYNIRLRMSGHPLEGGADTLGLNDVSCDLLEYRRLLSEGAFDDAASLLLGDFCEDLDVRGCVEFHHWLDTARESIRRISQPLAEEPLQPHLQTRVSEFLKLDSVRPPRSPADTDARSHRPFVGRVPERTTLEEVWRGSIRGKVVTALVTGDAGIGKTALCERTVKKTVLKGSKALMARGYEVQRNLPYGIVSQLLYDANGSGLLRNVPAKWLGVLHDLAPVIEFEQQRDVPSPRADRHMFAGAIHHALTEISTTQPLTVFVDDVQWADAASMGILHYVAHCGSNLPIFLLLASRRPTGDFFREGRWSLGAYLELAGLSLTETKTLMSGTHRSAGAVNSDVETLHRTTHGNPLLIHALATKTVAPNSRLPPSARQYYRHELGRMSKEAQVLGAVLAAAGSPLLLADLSWIADLGEEVTTGALNDLVEGGLVKADPYGGGFVLTHDIVGEAFLEIVSAVDSAKLHGRVAKFLRDSGSPIAVVATQLTVAGSDPETCRYALEAAQASLRLYAYREAEHFYRIAIAGASTPSIELEARIALSQILLRQGRPEEAGNILSPYGTENRLTSTETASLEAHRLIARLAEAAPPAVPKTAFIAARKLEGLLPPGVAARLYVDIASNAQQGLHDLVEKATEAALRPLSSMEDGPARIGLEVQLAALQAMNATHVNLAWIDRLSEESARWPDSLAACHSAGGLVQVSRGEIADAEARFTRALHICEQYGFFDQRLKVINNLGVCFLEQGRWSAAEQQFKAVVAAGGAVAPKEVSSASANLVTLAYERGHFEQAVELGEQRLLDPQVKTRLQLVSLGLLGLSHLELGQLSKARDVLNTIQTNSPSDEGWSNDVSHFEIFLARMAVIDGNAEAAERRLLEQVSTFANRDFYCSARMDVERIRISIAHSPKAALAEAQGLRERLAKARAIPLVDRVDRLLEKCLSRLGN